MLRFIISITYLFCSSCSIQPSPILVVFEGRKDALTNPVQLEVYLSDASESLDCIRILEHQNPRLEFAKVLVFNSLAEFETQGFASLQIDHVHASRKLLLYVVAIDPKTLEVTGTACLDNIEVEKNSLREVHLVLSPSSGTGAQE